MGAALILSPEVRLLLLSAGPRENDAAIGSLLEEDLDWGLLFHLAVREHAVPILWERLRRIDAEAVPTGVAQRLQQFTHVSHFRQLHLEHRLRETLEVLHRDGVDVLLLKGAGLALTAYGSFAERPMLDLDLLVRPEDADRALELVSRVRWKGPENEANSSFYAQHHHLAPLEDGDGTEFSLELHTDLFPRGHVFGLTPNLLWRDAVTVPLAGAWVASPIHQLLHLSLHFAWSHFMSSSGWKTFRDIGTLLRTSAIDWDSFAEEAERGHASTACFWTFRLASELCGVRIPEAVLAGLRPRGGSLLLNRLERHFAGSVLGFGVVCPSMRLQRWMWTLGMQPERSGHGPVRPWDGSRRYVAEYGSRDPQGSWTLRDHARAWRGWSRYLSALVRPRGAQ